MLQGESIKAYCLSVLILITHRYSNMSRLRASTADTPASAWALNQTKVTKHFFQQYKTVALHFSSSMNLANCKYAYACTTVRSCVRIIRTQAFYDSDARCTVLCVEMYIMFANQNVHKSKHFNCCTQRVRNKSFKRAPSILVSVIDTNKGRENN